MKKLLTLLLWLSAVSCLAQTGASTVKVEDLAAPASPAFILTDLTPTLVQNPGTPKSFVLGIAQSYQPSTNSFPNNYAAEFTPYWWMKPGQLSVYDIAGIQTDPTTHLPAARAKENIFSGLRFSGVSIAFINKDLIPDAAADQQKVFAIGLRTTLIKVHRSDYATDLNQTLVRWHTAALAEFAANAAIQQVITLHPEKQDELLKNWKDLNTGKVMDEINALLNEKPRFSWDLAAAYAIYGINDQEYKPGRAGIWTTLSTYLPLALGPKVTPASDNYLNLNILFRYQNDQFYKDDLGMIGAHNSLDFGGKAALIFNQLSIGVESLYRFNNGKAADQNRTIGVLNFKIADNIYLNGSFGKNFDAPDKLITAIGINWGIGKEKVNLP
jgi:hypothetical protein